MTSDQAKHRFSNSARTRQEVLRLAEKLEVKPIAKVELEQFRGVDWLMGRRRLLVMPTVTGEVKSARALIRRYASMVLWQQDKIMRRWFWCAIGMALLVGIIGGAVGAATILVK